MSESSSARRGDGSSEEDGSTKPTRLASRQARRGLNTSDHTEASAASLIDSSDKYRMGTPGKLLPLPLQDSPISPNEPIAIAWPTILQPRVIEKVRREHQLNVHTVSLVHRHLSTEVPSDNDITVMVIATAGSSDQWVFFLDDTYSLLSTLGFEHLHIEIVDPRAVNGLQTYPIQPDDKAVTWWPQIRFSVLAELRNIDCYCLQIVKRGYGFAGAKVTTTIMITAKDMFHRDWVQVSRKIEAILEENDSVGKSDIVNVDIIQGGPVYSVDDAPVTALRWNQFEEKPAMGASIGPKNHSGTLGGYLNLTSPEGLTFKVAITNWHVMREKGMAEPYDETGISNGRARALNLKAFSPCLLDIDRSIEFEESQIRVRDPRIASARQKIEWGAGSNVQATLNGLLEANRKSEEAINRMKKFDPSFGHLLAGGGLRSDDRNYPTDWALIAPIPQRIGQNLIPPEGSFDPEETGYGPGIKTVHSIDCKSLVVVHPGNKVFKKGRSSGLTWGFVNAIETEVFTIDEPKRRYTAVDICPPGKGAKSFSELGDSGSAILDEEGNWAGLMYGATTPTLGQGAGKGHGLVIPMNNIIADITKVTGYKVSVPFED